VNCEVESCYYRSLLIFRHRCGNETKRNDIACYNLFLALQDSFVGLEMGVVVAIESSGDVAELIEFDCVTVIEEVTM
jgi:hypothetical protein